MARINKGILGGFSGKVGTVVGANWRGKDIIRSVPKPTKRQPTDLQKMQQQRFMAVVEFLQPLRHIQNLYFGSRKKFASRSNEATSYVLKNAVEMVNDEPVIVPEHVLITKGDLATVQEMALTVQPGKLVLAWGNNSGQGNAAATDLVSVACYCKQLQTFLLFEDAAQRSEAAVTLDVPEAFRGKALDVWTYLHTQAQNKASTSMYQGIFTVM